MSAEAFTALHTVFARVLVIIRRGYESASLVVDDSVDPLLQQYDLAAMRFSSWLCRPTGANGVRDVRHGAIQASTPNADCL